MYEEEPKDPATAHRSERLPFDAGAPSLDHRVHWQEPMAIDNGAPGNETSATPEFEDLDDDIMFEIGDDFALPDDPITVEGGDDPTRSLHSWKHIKPV
ncbi:hypothetical protein HDV00_004441 [Rhizophlyctis rosea]|nr:hypothetical protein HDV00_004441 [Rhizophlyctis rosea]